MFTWSLVLPASNIYLSIHCVEAAALSKTSLGNPHSAMRAILKDQASINVSSLEFVTSSLCLSVAASNGTEQVTMVAAIEGSIRISFHRLTIGLVHYQSPSNILESNVKEMS